MPYFGDMSSFKVPSKEQVRSATRRALRNIPGFVEIPEYDEYHRNTRREGHKRSGREEHRRRSHRRPISQLQPPSIPERTSSHKRVTVAAAMESRFKHTSRHLSSAPPSLPIPDIRLRTPAQRAEDAERREYQKLYGGNHSLKEYYAIHREKAFADKHRRNEPSGISHRRGSLDVVIPRHPRESATDRVRARYDVAMREQKVYEERGNDPFRHRPQPQPVSELTLGERDTWCWNEREFQGKFARMNRADDKRSRRHGRYGAPAGVNAEYFDIPSPNRGDDMFRVDVDRIRIKNANQPLRRPYIQHIPVAQKPMANGHFDYF